MGIFDIEKISVTSELTNALQLNIMGQTRNLQCMLDHCRSIYPSLFVSQNYQQQDVFKEADKTEHTNSKNEEIPLAGHGQNLLELQETVHEVVTDLPLHTVLNLNLDNTHYQNEGELQNETHISEEEIKDMLETVFCKAIKYITESHTNVESDCCQIGTACHSCRNEISRIVESILIKVMESPRFKVSPRYSSTANSHKTHLETSQHQLQILNRLPNQVEEDLTPISGKTKNTDDCDRKLESNAASTNMHTFNLDCDVVKNNLLGEDNDTKIQILRALRRGLTKSNESERKKTLEAYIRYDVLNIHGNQSFVEVLLQIGSSHADEQVFRLINTIASFRQGRSYLNSNDKLLKTVLVPKLMEASTSPTRDMLLAALQKLSLQKHMRTCMVYDGVLDYLIKFLDEFYQELSLYTLEHCTALLMNLTLVDEARKYCEANADKIVKLLMKFLREPRTAYLPYINGTMLSLLAYENINMEAKKNKLDEIIHQLIKNIKDDYLRRQLAFIMQLRFGQQLQSFIGDETENSEKNDILESELDTDSDEQVSEEGPCQKLDKPFPSRVVIEK